MCSSSYSSLTSAPTTSRFLLTHSPSLFRRRNASIFTAPSPFLRNLRTTYPKLSLPASFAERSLDLEWSSPDPNPNSNNSYRGWEIVDSPVRKEKTGGHPFVIGIVGTSLAVLVAFFAYFSLSRKGLKFQTLYAFQRIFSRTETKEGEGETVEYSVSNVDAVDAEAQSTTDAPTDTLTSGLMHKHERVTIPVRLDSAQEEALSVLKKLKIVEADIEAGELCTRREYARWLVRINSTLERHPKHRIAPSVLPSGLKAAAFDDVSPDDPDFGFIQALAEAGIVHSKLSWKNSAFDGSESQENVYFLPDRFINRQDLIDWKAQLEYEFVGGMLEQISSTKVSFMDMKDITSDASPELFMDFFAEEKSILRKVFGHIKRLQPNKPATKTQAMVALASGRMTEAIQIELSRLKSQSITRKAVMEQIKMELLDRGILRKVWEEKQKEEKIRLSEAEKDYLAAASALEEEQIVQEKFFSENLKEKAAMDCQRQLVLSLKEEVDLMTEKLASEKAIYVSERCSLGDVLSDLLIRCEETIDTKSVLEAEIEAIRILRSWVEDEARKSQARSKVLEEVGRRWKWDNQG